jgi:hypothetical protein
MSITYYIASVDLKMPKVDVNLEHTTFVVLSLGLTSGTFKAFGVPLDKLADTDAEEEQADFDQE